MGPLANLLMCLTVLKTPFAYCCQDESNYTHFFFFSKLIFLFLFFLEDAEQLECLIHTSASSASGKYVIPFKDAHMGGHSKGSIVPEI